MKKILFLIFISLFCFNSDVTFATNSTEAITTIIAESTAELVDAVEAQDMRGYKKMNLGIYGRRMANGKYHYFAKTKGGTREFDIQYADNNKYKPFYVKINGERWYFSSKVLDYNSGKTDQW